MVNRSSSSRGCGTCGGGSFSSPAATPSDTSCGCGCGPTGSTSCGCSSGTAMVRAQPAQTRTYDSAQCPTFAISCETKQALRECAKVALCDLLRCVSEALCPDGKFDIDRLSSSGGSTSAPPTTSAPPERSPLQTELINCLGQAACSFIHCVPQALCPEPCAVTAAPIDCLPCGYAVEVVR